MRPDLKPFLKLTVLFALLAMPFLITAQPLSEGIPISFSSKEEIVKSQYHIPFRGDIEELTREDVLFKEEGLPMRAGFSLPLSLNPKTDGEWIRNFNGYNIWRVQLNSPGAKALGIVMNDFFIPEGGALYIYKPDKSQLIGAYTSLHNNSEQVISTQFIEGESIIVEYQEKATIGNKSFDLFSCQITELVYLYNTNFPLGDGKDLGSSGPCEVNINCSPEGDNWQTEKQGVARIILREGTTWYYCTGSLVNNTLYDAKPYFLTADHCGQASTPADFLVWQFYFNYERPDCSNTGTPVENMITGANLRAKGNINGGTDYKLLELISEVPSAWNPYYNGWDRSIDPSASGVCIHHPSGDAKKISIYQNPISQASWSGSMANAFWEVKWVSSANGTGVTEGGSSGSPLFNSNKRIIGTLTGGGSSCSYPAFPDFYGQFAKHWNANGTDPNQSLASWLDPLNVNPSYMDGYQPGVAPVAPVSSFQAADNGLGQVVLSWDNNPSGQPVIIASSASTQIGDPILGIDYQPGDNIPGGGTVIYKGNLSSFTHTYLFKATNNYKIWAYNNTFYYSEPQSTSVLLDVIEISVAANPLEGGTVSGGGQFLDGELVSLSAGPNEFYNFVNWTEDGTEVSSNPEYSFNATISRSLVANFVLNSYTISVASNPEAGGAVSGGGSYSHGSIVNLTATAITGYSFVNWTENGTEVSTNPDYSFTATSNLNLVANFVLNTYTISATSNPEAGGSVSGGGSYSHGSLVNLTATTNTGYSFVNWTENGTEVSTNPDYSFIATSNSELIANFSLNIYSISVAANPLIGGTINGGGTYFHGGNVNLTAIPNVGYSFVNWTENGEIVSTSPDYSFTALADRTLIANFSLNSYSVNLAANPENGGSVSGGGSFNHGELVVVNAVNNEGYIFLNWSENGNVVSYNPEYSFTIQSNRNLIANFQLITFNIQVSANPVTGGFVGGGGTYNYGQTVTLFAIPAESYNFIHWTEDGEEVSTNPDYSFTALANRNLVAVFEIKTYTILTLVNPTEGGTATGGGTYNHGQSVVLNAIPNTGYDFLNWTENGNIVSSQAQYSFTANANRELTANFQIKTYNVTVLANPVDGGLVSGTGTYSYGQEIIAYALPYTGFSFINWTSNGQIVSTDASYSFIVTANITLTANFQVSELILNMSSIGNGTTTPATGEHTYQYGSVVSIEATPGDGWAFEKWVVNGVTSVSNPYQVTIVTNTDAVAHFVEVPQFDVSIQVIGEGTTVPAAGSYTYNQGSVLNLDAIPDENWVFRRWTVNGSYVNTSQAQVVINQNTAIIAEFVPEEWFALHVSSLGNGTVEIDPYHSDSLYLIYSQVTLHAIPEEGFRLKRWFVNGTQLASTEPDITLVMNGEKTVVAEFELIIGIASYKKEADILVYPNPSHGQFKLLLNKAFTDMDIQIYSMAGRLIESKTINPSIAGELIDFDLSDQPDGLYFIRIETEGTIRTFKVSIVK